MLASASIMRSARSRIPTLAQVPDPGTARCRERDGPLRVITSGPGAKPRPSSAMWPVDGTWPGICLKGGRD